MVMNSDYASTSTESTNRDNANRATVTTNNNSDTNDNNLLNDDNNIENWTITRDEDNTVINTFINSEGRIEGMVEENLQVVIVQGPPAQGYPPCPNDVNLNLNLNNNGRWRNNATQHIRPNCNN